ncbi:MAG: homoserine kinase [Tissierellia bacterium]|nr:homoserine kinase [Tissierellia bacterium]
MIKVKVPATSANLGPGFDVLGLAIDRYNIFTFVESAESKEENLIYKSYRRVFEYLGKPLIPVKIQVNDNIPIARGLGSSAACIVGGIMGANEILGKPLDKEDILKLATEIEGHPDNVAPAIYGGLVVSVMEGDKIHIAKLPIKNKLNFIALVPNFELSTSKAREVLPKRIDFKDGIYNVSRVSILLTALATGDSGLIKLGLQDKFHQPYRGKLIEGFDEIISAVNQKGALGCYLSGAGPTIMCIGPGEDNRLIKDIQEYVKDEYPAWEVFVHKVDNIGALSYID